MIRGRRKKKILDRKVCTGYENDGGYFLIFSSEIGKGYPQVGPMSNENEDPPIDDIHGLCDSTNFGGDFDSAYESQQSDTPHSPVDETSDPFQDAFPIEHSQIEPAEEEPVEFHYKNEYAIDDITKGIAFVLVHEHKAEKIGSANIRSIVEAGKINYWNNNVDFDDLFQ